MESPTNPLLKLVDIAALAGLADRHKLLLVVDNTFASPYLQQPLNHGAHVVVHSTTKYLGGHSDVIGGAFITSDAARSMKPSSITRTPPGPYPVRGIRGLCCAA